MSWTKKEWGLIGIVTLILFISTNLFAHFVILHYLGVTIFDTDLYKNKKNIFKKDSYGAQIPHPFFGITSLDDKPITNKLTSEPLFNSISTINVKQPIKVLVLGGSVAHNLSSYGETSKEIFANMLNKHFKTQKFVVYNAAIGGGKQPQQYFKFLYLDLINFRPDIVINLDGFNEIALPLVENKRLAIPIIFPRSYSRLLHSSTAERSCSKYSNKLLSFDTYLPISELIIMIIVRNCHYKIEDDPDTIPWWSFGLNFNEKQDLVNQSVDIWEQSSNKLDQLLRARGIDYVHALQPNQYLAGSKVLSKVEKENFINLGAYGKQIFEHYSRLSKVNLSVENFTDQRFLFKEISATVYRDDCCHFNQLGMELIVKNIIISNESVFKKHLLK